MKLSTADKDAICLIIKKNWPSVWAIYLFGSFVTGETQADSDIDLAVLSEIKPDPEAVLRMRADLSGLFHRDVDLVDLRRADSVTKAQVITSGEVLLAPDATRTAFFETAALSEYALLNEERAGIIADIVAKGSIHGR